MGKRAFKAQRAQHHRRHRRRGEDLLAELFDAHARAVARLAERLTGDAPFVDDIVQDVFLVAHRHADEVAGAANRRGWLYAVTLRVARDHQKRRRRRSGLRQRFPDRPQGPPPPAPSTAAEQAQHGRLLRACIGELAEKYREPFVLYELEGLDGDAIARLLDIPKNTVWTRLRKARALLRQRLVRRGLTPGGAS